MLTTDIYNPAGSIADAPRLRWAIKLAFDTALPADDRDRLFDRLVERARLVGVDAPVALGPEDEWPSCSGELDCLTVAQTLTNG